MEGPKGLPREIVLEMNKTVNDILKDKVTVDRLTALGMMASPSIPEEYLKYYQEGKMPVDRLMIGTMRFDQLNLNLDLLERGEVVRQVLLPNA